MRLFRIWLLIVAGLLLLGGPSAADTSTSRRVALVIGNDRYEHLVPLANSGRDAQLIRTSLERAGYEVVVALNLRQSELRDQLRRFRTAADGAASAVVFFSGHGVGSGGAQWVIPVDARIEQARDVALNAVSMDVIVEATRGARARVLAMDTDRNDPFAQATRAATGGLAEVVEDDMLILYATSDGQVSSEGALGQPSPFARALARYLVEPGLELRELAARVQNDVRAATEGDQTPQVFDYIRAPTYVIPPTRSAPLPAPTLSRQPRVALVVGVSDYNGDGDIDDTSAAAAAQTGALPDLRNARNDAEDIRDALSRLQFTELMYLPDPNQQALADAIIKQTARAKALGPDTIFVFFYAGHAMQVNGVNFLLPSRARLPDIDVATLTARQAESTLRSRSFAVTDLIDSLPIPGDRGANVIILDACRNNPWEDRLRGPARSGDVAGGLTASDVPTDLVSTLIAFSTASNRVALDGTGRNSPYTTALKRRLDAPGSTILNLFNEVSRDVRTATKTQTPWYSGAGLNPVCLGVCAS